jgi:hypothetical protein
MDNLSNKDSNSNSNIHEVLMSNENQIIELFQAFLSNGGAPKVTSFKKHLDQLISENVKPLCIRSGKTPDENDWRSQLKAQFSGRGAKWVQVSLDNILPALDKFDSEDFETSDYRAFIETAGFAWIRFAGPRIDFNIHSAAFEVRTNGSKIDHPKQLHYIPVTQLESLVKPLGGTPHSLKLEVIVKAEDATETLIDLSALPEEVEAMYKGGSDEPVDETTDFDMSQLDDLAFNQDDDNALASFDELYEDEDLFETQA